MAGTPRDEAERLVAAVLAMAGPAGAGDKVGERVAAGLSALSDTVSGFLGSLSDNGAGREGADDKDARGQTGDAASRDSSGGSGAGSSSGGSGAGSSSGGSSGGSSSAGSSSAGSSSAGSSSAGSSSAGSSSAGSSGGAGSSGSGSGSGSRHQGGAWATGSAECCVCPVCRAISTMRDPSPETAVKLAIGAGDLATGVASMMRAFSSIVGRRTPAKPPAARPRPRNRDENWSVATRTTNRPEDAWSAATNAAPAATAPAATAPAATAPTAPAPTATAPAAPAPTATAPTATAPARQTKDADSWSAATTASAAEASAEHAAQAAARAARRAAERAAQQAAQREAALAASRRAKEAAARVAEAVRLAEAARDLQNAGSDPALAEGPGAGDRAGGARPAQRTPRKRDVWAAATADAGVADAAGGATLDHDVPGTEAGDEARGGGTA
jgi:hypothetical protein